MIKSIIKIVICCSACCVAAYECNRICVLVDKQVKAKLACHVVHMLVCVCTSKNKMGTHVVETFLDSIRLKKTNKHRVPAFNVRQQTFKKENIKKEEELE